MIDIIMYLAIGFLGGAGLAVVTGKVPFLRDLFSESSTASFGRVGAGIALVASIMWISWVVYKSSAIPDLGGVSLFIGTLYGLSAAKSTVKAFSGTSDDPRS